MDKKEYEVIEVETEPFYNELLKIMEPRVISETVLFSSSSKEKCERWLNKHKDKYDSAWTYIV